MRQELYASVANNWASSHLEAARECANTFESTLEVWMSRDPAAAREFIEGSQELDAQTRWRLLTPR